MSRRRAILRGSLVSALVRELPGGDIRVVADRLVEELKKRNCTVYSLNAGRASTGKIAVIVKFREGK